jgi:GNAT superfamily N-acetyltransferase
LRSGASSGPAIAVLLGLKGKDAMKVEVAITDAEIDACYPCMQELRTHLQQETFDELVRDMQRDGYVLAYLGSDQTVFSVAGFRIKRTLFCDRFLYVDDLVTTAAQRSKGYGKILLEWLKDRARAEGCAQLHLDSGIRREDAHRFYQRNGVAIAGYHFRSDIELRVPWSRR